MAKHKYAQIAPLAPAEEPEREEAPVDEVITELPEFVPEVPVKEEPVEDEAEDAMSYLPPVVNVATMQAGELYSFAMRHFGRRLDESRPLAELRREVGGMMANRNSAYGR